MVTGTFTVRFALALAEPAGLLTVTVYVPAALASTRPKSNVGPFAPAIATPPFDQ